MTFICIICEESCYDYQELGIANVCELCFLDQWQTKEEKETHMEKKRIVTTDNALTLHLLAGAIREYFIYKSFYDSGEGEASKKAMETLEKLIIEETTKILDSEEPF